MDPNCSTAIYKEHNHILLFRAIILLKVSKILQVQVFAQQQIAANVNLYESLQDHFTLRPTKLPIGLD